MYTACILYTIFVFSVRTGAAVTAKKKVKKSLKLDCLTSITTQWWKERKKSHLQSNLKALISHSFNNLMESLNRLCWNIVAIHCWCCCCFLLFILCYSPVYKWKPSQRLLFS